MSATGDVRGTIAVLKKSKVHKIAGPGVVNQLRLIPALSAKRASPKVQHSNERFSETPGSWFRFVEVFLSLI